MVVEDFGEHSGMATGLISTRIANDIYGYCFSFFYSMSGDEGARLNVSTRSDDRKDTLWSLAGDQGQDWLYGQVSGRRRLLTELVL